MSLINGDLNYRDLFFYTAPEDYGFVSTVFIFNNISQQASVMVPIMEDALLEANETFKAEINLVRMEDSNCILLEPSIADITILDNDSEL